MSLYQHNLLLGVCGSIAAYKAAELARLLIKAKANVRVVMTQSAKAFIGEMTFQAITDELVRSELFDPEHEESMGHIELARWADFILIAPATANSISNFANGHAVDLLSNIVLVTDATIGIAPAMNQQMWANSSTTANIESLRQRGYLIYGPASGEQACGEVGLGRMLKPVEILRLIEQKFSQGVFAGVKVMITAGPTHEAIDPVRYITNRSSGKMGFALAQAFAEAGAEVCLIAGPVSLPTPKRIKRIDVTSAKEMHQAVMSTINEQQIFVSAAAVTDYSPVEPQTQKIKKTSDSLNLALMKNRDILADVASLKSPPFTCGFAAETEHIAQYAQAKLETKKLDMVAANHVGQGEGGFASDENALLLIYNGGETYLEMQPKLKLARQLVLRIKQVYDEKNTDART